jgi:hypothetical protein
MWTKLWLVLLVPLAACSAPAEEDDIGSAQLAIQDGEPAGSFARQHAALLHGDFLCTATRIGSRYFITALRCRPKLGDHLHVYPNGNEYGAEQLVINAVVTPPGTSIANVDWTDSNDRLADIAVLRTETAPASGSPVRVSWAYPGPDKAGFKVGAGAHEGNPNLAGFLMQKDDLTYSGNDSGGGFRTSEFALDDGDIGGAFYRTSALLGVAHDNAPGLPLRAYYTSTSRHLDWIIEKTRFHWSGEDPQNRRLQGQEEQIIDGSFERCQYACQHTGSCMAFSYRNSNGECRLLNTVALATPSNDYRSAYK